MNKTKQNNFQFQIKYESDLIRLDHWLVEQLQLKDFVPTRSFAQNLIEKNHVLINGKKSKASTKLKINDVVTVLIPEPKPTELIPYKFDLDILFEDKDVLVVNKPAGLVVHPAAGHEQDTLVNALIYHTQNLSLKNEMRPGIVHRIDKETSGLLVIAKNDKAHEALAEQFKNKTTHRIYYAVTEGSLKSSQGTIKSYLARHPVDRKKYSSIKQNNKIINSEVHDFEKGKWSVTHYSVLEKKSGLNYVQLKLETGRTHQIRVHMSEIGCCLVGDTTYGYSIKKYKEQNLNRFFLHAAELGFLHPTTHEQLLFKSTWPQNDYDKIKSWGFKIE